jgi:Effector Associated Constant Component 1
MTETYTIESADGSVPIDPRLLRELRDLLREDEDLDLGVRLKDRPPAPGEQGAIPVALEIVSAATPMGTAFAGVLMHWINTRKVRIKVRRGDDSVELSAGNVNDAERLIAKLKS